MVLTMVGIAIAVILVSNLVLGTAFAPIQPTITSTANTAKYNKTNLNQSNSSGYTFVVSNVDTNAAGYVELTYVGMSASTINATSQNGATKYCELDGTSPDTCNIAA